MRKIYKRQVRLSSEEEKRVTAFLKAQPFFEGNFSVLTRIALDAFLKNPSIPLQKVITLDDYLSQMENIKRKSEEIKTLLGSAKLPRKKRDPLKAKLLKELYGEK